MIDYQEIILNNGLQVLIHEDHSSPQAVVNMLYNVGSKDEETTKTGFAHLFEHLMFGGSVNIPSYDTPLQKVGGENNAFTTPDITNYYLTLPSSNLETAFWLESDRMLGLSFDPQVLEVQRKVVIEEFKQRYLNQPFGDAWLKLRPLAYKRHPYQWATIGKDISHIEKASMDDVKDFFRKYYHPGNAVMVVAGDVTPSNVQELCEKWFTGIPKGPDNHRILTPEPKQQEARLLELSSDMQVSAFYQVFHIPARYQPEYYQADLVSDILGRGKSSRLYQKLVKEQPLFSSISAHVTGSLDPGLLVVQGKLVDGISCETGHKAVRQVMDSFLAACIDDKELDKVKNQAESSLVFSEINLLNRAMSLAVAAAAGNADYANQEPEIIRSITARQIMNMAHEILREENSSTLYYHKKSA
ncbi:MAG: peptidase M16 [Cyclobacteriaceae bacterium]|nr:MAG: peptidase M16 [Cyclobacteriaceae bacterium]